MIGTLLIFRKHIYSIFDPLFFSSIMSSCAYAVVFYLYYFDLITFNYFLSFLLTQAGFVLGFLINKPIKLNKITFHACRSFRFSDSPVYFLYPLSVFLFVLSQLAVYYFSGLPLLMESRHETFSTGSGYGLFSRIIYVTSNISLSLATYRMIYLKENIFIRSFDYLVVLFYVLTAILSGSKGTMLIAIFIIFLTVLFARKMNLNPHVEKKANTILIGFLILAFPAAFLTLFMQSDVDDYMQLIMPFLLRFMHTGNIFYMTYPNNVIDHLDHNSNVFFVLFQDILGSLRLVPWHELPTNLGLQVFRYHNVTDLIGGPNSRHNVFGLFYFGFYYSILFSFILGFIVSFIRNVIYVKAPATPLWMITYVLLAISSNFIEQDPVTLALGYLFSIFLILPPLYFLAVMLFHISKKPVRAGSESPLAS